MKSHLSTKELYEKLSNSGTNGAPVITDDEMEDLRSRLADIRNFLKVHGDSFLFVGMNILEESIEQILRARKKTY